MRSTMPAQAVGVSLTVSPEAVAKIEAERIQRCKDRLELERSPMVMR